MADVRNELNRSAVMEYRDFANKLADAAGTISAAAFHAGFQVARKADRSFVTSADLAVEQRLRELIAQAYPEHGIIGEEQPPVHPEAPFQWILDPIDGTEDFAHGIVTFGTIVALHYRNTPIVGVLDHPLLGVRVAGAFGLGTFHNGTRVQLSDLAPEYIDSSERIMISARANFTRYGDHGQIFDTITRAHPNHRIYRTCYAHVLVIVGGADAMFDYGNRLWDVAASQILVEEAGGKYVEVPIATIGEKHVYGAIFGKARLVERLAAYI